MIGLWMSAAPQDFEFGAQGTNGLVWCGGILIIVYCFLVPKCGWELISAVILEMKPFSTHNGF